MIVNIYVFSTASKGQGANMLKIGVKRRRSRMEMEADKMGSSLKEQSIKERLNQSQMLFQRNQELEQIAAQAQQDSSILN